MDKRKENRLTKLKEKLQNEKKSEEQVTYERKVRKGRLETEIKCFQREIEFKKKQIDSGEITETFSITTQNGATTSYKDGVKPKHHLENEIDRLNHQITEMEDQLKEIRKIEEKDGKAT